MATYDYQCTKCDTIQEIRHGMTEAPKLLCNQCHTRLKKLITLVSDGQVGKYWEGSEYADTKYRPREMKTWK